MSNAIPCPGHRFAVNRHQLRRRRSQSRGGAPPPMCFEFGGHGPAARIVLILLTLGVLSGPD